MPGGRVDPSPAPAASPGAEPRAEGARAGDEGDRPGREGAAHLDIREQHVAQPAAPA